MSAVHDDIAIQALSVSPKRRIRNVKKKNGRYGDGIVGSFRYGK